MFEAVELLIFCHEEAAESVERRTVGVNRAVISPAPAQTGQAESSLVIKPGMF